MKVVRAYINAGMRKWRQPRGLHVNHSVLILQRALNQQKLAARDHQAVALVNIGSHDHVGDAGFIFHREKDESLRGSRPLPGDHAAGRAHKHAVAAIAQIV